MNAFSNINRFDLASQFWPSTAEVPEQPDNIHSHISGRITVDAQDLARLLEFAAYGASHLSWHLLSEDLERKHDRFLRSYAARHHCTSA